MEFLTDTVVLSRMQFALTSIFHMLWPVLTTGMGIYLVIVEGLWLKNRNPDYYHHARFWSKLYAFSNIREKLVTDETSHPLKSWLKS